MNRVILLGRLGATPEIKETGSGISVTNFSLAIDRKGKGNDKVTDWIDCVAWRSTAEFICKYFQKGSPIIAEGSLQTRVWEDRDGKSRKGFEVLVENVEFVPGSKAEKPVDEDGFTETETDDLPF